MSLHGISRFIILALNFSRLGWKMAKRLTFKRVTWRPFFHSHSLRISNVTFVDTLWLQLPGKSNTVLTAAHTIQFVRPQWRIVVVVVVRWPFFTQRETTLMPSITLRKRRKLFQKPSQLLLLQSPRLVLHNFLFANTFYWRSYEKIFKTKLLLLFWKLATIIDK